MTLALSRLTVSLHRRVVNELQPDEKVLWAGMPSPWRTALMTTPIFIFGVAWSSFTFGWEWIALNVAWAAFFQEPPQGGAGVPLIMALIFPIFGIPFVLIGIGMLGAPFYAAFKTMCTAHVVTSERLLTVISWPFEEVSSHPVTKVQSLNRKDRRGGRGSLKISFGSRRDSDGDTVETAEWWAGCADVRGAEDAIRNASGKWKRGDGSAGATAGA